MDERMLRHFGVLGAIGLGLTLTGVVVAVVGSASGAIAYGPWLGIGVAAGAALAGVLAARSIKILQGSGDQRLLAQMKGIGSALGIAIVLVVVAGNSSTLFWGGLEFATVFFGVTALGLRKRPSDLASLGE